MAVDILSENLVGCISPRISFSNDFEDDETSTISMVADLPRKLDHILADSTIDFAFNVGSSISFQSSTADELFFNGKILPTGIKKEEEEVKIVQIQTPPLMPCLDPPHPKAETEAKKKSLKDFLEDTIEEREEQPNTMSRSFWKFRKSNSLNCDKNQNKGFIGSLKILPRSGSTGKFLEKIVEEVEIENPCKKPSFWKLGKSSSLNSANVLNPFRRSSSLNCDTRKGVNQGLIGSANLLSRSFSTGSAPKKQQQIVAIDAKSSKKRQVKSNCKGYGYGHYSKNARVSHVLNIPSPYISRASVDLFGFGSLFCNGNTKDRKKRK